MGRPNSRPLSTFSSKVTPVKRYIILGSLRGRFLSFVLCDLGDLLRLQMNFLLWLNVITNNDESMVILITAAIRYELTYPGNSKQAQSPLFPLSQSYNV